MQSIVGLIADAAVFILVPWIVWRVVGRTIPFAVLPIMVGLGIAAFGGAPAEFGIPSSLGVQLGWAGVLLLAFTAGLETRMMTATTQEDALSAPPMEPVPLHRLVGSALAALLLPLLAGTLVAYWLLIDLPGWPAPRAQGWLSAAAIGLCLAVSALPVLIGIVRELRAGQRVLGNLALKVAVLDDAALWCGLALLLLIADGRSALERWSGYDLFAVAVLAVLAVVGRGLRRKPVPPRWLACSIALAYLATGAWASSRLGLHALLGGYFAGAVMAPQWIRKLPVEGTGALALFGLAAVFFGHSGLRIDEDALTWGSLLVACGLFVLSAVTKLLAAWTCPVSASLSARESLAVGALLQCKGLMEIVAATILRDQGLISERAFAALVTLAVVSTLLTGPLFHAIVRRKPRAFAQPPTKRRGSASA
jgi:Kef-type K+ transport system membrane component KefB